MIQIFLATGTHLGPYEIVGQIDAGGMGEVYRGRDCLGARSDSRQVNVVLNWFDALTK
ncbi:hypothetical protein BH18ACI5_BH18ACI5_30270 [soil metagenome]